MDEPKKLKVATQEAAEKFAFVHDLTGGYEVLLRVADHPKRPDDFLLTFGVEQFAKPARLAVVTDRQTLLELAQYILRVLDSTPHEKILESLSRIEKTRQSSLGYYHSREGEGLSLAGLGSARRLVAY